MEIFDSVRSKHLQLSHEGRSSSETQEWQHVSLRIDTKRPESDYIPKKSQR